jgi:pectate lyase
MRIRWLVTAALLLVVGLPQPALAAPVLVNCTGDRVTSGSAFTPGSFYSYTLDAAADVPALLRQYAGPQADIGV